MISLYFWVGFVQVSAQAGDSVGGFGGAAGCEDEGEGAGVGAGAEVFGDEAAGDGEAETAVEDLVYRLVRLW